MMTLVHEPDEGRADLKYVDQNTSSDRDRDNVQNLLGFTCVNVLSYMGQTQVDMCIQ